MPNLKLLIAADFVPQERVLSLIKTDNYCFFDDIRRFTNRADYSIINMEAPVVHEGLSNPIRKTGPNLWCPKNTIKSIQYGGFNAVTLANNHYRDYGQNGVECTLAACIEARIDYVGGGADFHESRKILYKEINGIRLAIINVCEHEWSVATDEYGGSNPLNPLRQYYDIIAAKRRALYVVVIVHGGTEWYNLPTPRMKETYRFFIDAGADAVINHHQHCYSGYEVYNGKPIFYGLGNFCFDKGKTDRTFWNEGYMVMFNMNDGSINYELIPYVQCAGEPTISILEDRKEFDNSIKILNAIIADDNALKREFKELAMKRERVIKNFMAPYSSLFLQRLLAKKLLPSFCSKKRLMQLLAQSQCESHRDLMIEYLHSIT